MRDVTGGKPGYCVALWFLNWAFLLAVAMAEAEAKESLAAQRTRNKIRGKRSCICPCASKPAGCSRNGISAEAAAVYEGPPLYLQAGGSPDPAEPVYVVRDSPWSHLDGGRPYVSIFVTRSRLLAVAEAKADLAAYRKRLNRRGRCLKLH